MVTPLSIRMERWCTKACQQRMDTYQLMSVVSHTGSSSSSGHYLSYVRVPKLKAVCTQDSKSRESPQPVDQYEWVLFDDDQVSALSEQEFESCINQPSESQELFDTPYLLFYSRVTTEKNDWTNLIVWICFNPAPVYKLPHSEDIISWSQLIFNNTLGFPFYAKLPQLSLTHCFIHFASIFKDAKGLSTLSKGLWTTWWNFKLC